MLQQQWEPTAQETHGEAADSDTKNDRKRHRLNGLMTQGFIWETTERSQPHTYPPTNIHKSLQYPYSLILNTVHSPSTSTQATSALSNWPTWYLQWCSFYYLLTLHLFFVLNFIRKGLEKNIHIQAYLHKIFRRLPRSLMTFAGGGVSEGLRDRKGKD